MGLRRRMAGQVGGILAATLVLASAAMAQDPIPPLPPPRPDRPAEPLPPPRPVFKVEPETEQRAEEVPRNETPLTQQAELDSEDKDCLQRLTQRGLRFESRPPVKENGCGIENPVLVSALPNGVTVVPASLMGCPAAESIARWMSDVVAPEAERQFQTTPTKLLIGTSYQCRDQRNGAKLSEHAFGNGLDIMGFEFAKRAALTIGSHAENSPEATFQSTIRKAACPIFNTVLGPGSDASHGDHLHLDLRQRKGDYRICQ
ncbi:extensin family protein [Microvirga sp. VF16]|uniref:extensin-like domain-containing protein n=1 Tax=Microvirga sp. VF16 TaxID=2807101 RepID=UPI00193CDE07|nr:extensin family protein [Microvirga sp. VF16]QRM31504.1 extensin family protein [Microvirga sp. VF16]